MMLANSSGVSSIFWAYIAFCQYMLIWYANLPEETAWYNSRQSVFLVDRCRCGVDYRSLHDSLRGVDVTPCETKEILAGDHGGVDTRASLGRHVLPDWPSSTSLTLGCRQTK